MINPAQIKQKAQRNYTKFLQASIKNENFFPLTLPLGKIPQDYLKLRDELSPLIAQSKSQIGYGYTLELTPKNTRKYGRQSLPTKISIDIQEDYLKLLNKQTEFKKFQANVKLIRSLLPKLETWLFQNPRKVIDYDKQWEDLLKVCLYFQDNPCPNLYIRELPIKIHTKFIEQNKTVISSLLEAILPPQAIQIVDKNSSHIFEQKFSLRYDEPLVRLRILDKQIKKTHNFPISDLLTPLSEFKHLDLKYHNCFITENKMNFLTLPNLKNSIAIWGGGYRTHILQSVNWLNFCNIFYWGDIDADGFKILSQFRTYFPQTVSIMMNQDTFKTFEKFAVNIKESEPENISNLTTEEYNLYSYVSKSGTRLEQEHISQDFALQNLSRSIFSDLN